MFQRPIAIRTEQPLISFTFDDFPKSALATGGAILRSHQLSGTYYVSLGILGGNSPSGQLCELEDVVEALKQGHELGCHTFAHCHSWDTKSAVFEEAVLRNRAALRELVPWASFRTCSYPIATPRPAIKRVCAKYFECSRAGGQTFNSGSADLNQLSAFFLEKAKGDLEEVKRVIRENRKAKGWLVFATHEIVPCPSEYGCTAQFFEQVVRYAMESGARILPVAQALDVVSGRA